MTAGAGTDEDRGSVASAAAVTDLALAEAVRQSRDAITVTTAALDAPGPEIVFVNPAFTRMTGYEAAEVLGRSPRLMQGPRTERAVLDRLVADLRAGGTFAGETVNYRKGGEPFRIEWEITPVRDASGRTTHYVAVQRDVTERRHAANAEAALRRLAELVARGAPPEAVFARVAEDAARLLGGDGGGVARIDLSGTRTIVGTWAAPGSAALPLGAVVTPIAGDAADRLRHADADGLVLPPTHPLWPLGYRRQVAAAIRVAGRPWGLVAVAARGERDLPAAAAELLRDFADLVALAIDNTAIRVELERRATTDPLTGLANHRLLHEILADETARASRYGRNLSLIVLDLDRFKEINDRHGHRTGDEVLRETAQRLGLQIRAGETLARVGGEEFAWVLPETTAAQAGEAAERARRALAARPMAGVGTVTFSAGVCDLARASDSETLYRLADGALYWAKAGGRNRVVVYRPEVVEDLSAAERVDRLEHGHAQAGVRALARIVDARHPSTVGHSERVAELVSRLASARDWDLQRAVRLHDAALVHDIGKVGIADAVLLAPRPLDDVEYGQVKTHAALGAGILAEILLDEQVAWVRHHHERWDGGGYPDGLAGGAVPEGAQLLALADAFDVMRSERPYASTLSLADALTECRARAGSQFAPSAVEALLGLAEADLLGQAV